MVIISTEKLQDRIIRVTPNSIRAKEIITEHKERERKILEFKRREVETRKMHGKLVR
ncbi:MAG TPA: hypothetical protein VKA91_03360 [Nitrososphaeraceae archaeon]|nr:hypothetical protein [Nitrososphaeraceae archaeon]